MATLFLVILPNRGHKFFTTKEKAEAFVAEQPNPAEHKIVEREAHPGAAMQIAKMGA